MPDKRTGGEAMGDCPGTWACCVNDQSGTEKISRYGSHIAHHRHRGTMKKDERVGNIFFVIPKNRSMFAASFKRAIGLLSNYRTG